MKRKTGWNERRVNHECEPASRGGTSDWRPVRTRRSGEGLSDEERKDSGEEEEEEGEEGAECYHRGLRDAPELRAPGDCDTGQDMYETDSLFCRH